jgi:hypothetical protein
MAVHLDLAPVALDLLIAQGYLEPKEKRKKSAVTNAVGQCLNDPLLERPRKSGDMVQRLPAPPQYPRTY